MIMPRPEYVVQEEKLNSVVIKVRTIPDRYRNFSKPEADLARRYGIDAVLLSQLLERGFPHRGAPPYRLFDSFDLHNIGIDLQLPNSRWAAMRWWARSLTSLGHSDATRMVGLKAQCANPGQHQQCQISLNQVFVNHPHVPAITEHPDQFVLTLQLPTVDADLEDLIEPLVERARQLTFHLIADELANDHAFVMDTGLADCRLAAAELTRIGRDCDLDVRMMSGLFVTAPFPCRHSWIQLRHRQEWISIDPFHLLNMARWGIVDPDLWPPHRSPSSLLLALHQDWQPLVYDHAVPTLERFTVVGV